MTAARPERAGSIVETALLRARTRAQGDPDVALRLVRLCATRDARRQAYWWGAITGMVVTIVSLALAAVILRTLP
jgi:hypothetical protein